MPNPKDVFHHPDHYWAFLTASDDSTVEGQYFDRKEAGKRTSSDIVDKNRIDKLAGQITECISAFANSNREGGLLILGIAKDGRVTGFSHLLEQQRNRLTNTRAILVNHSAQVAFHPCQNSDGQADEICLVYVPYALHELCETIEQHPKAWLRQGAQNILMSETHRQSIRRDKRIVDFEHTYACPYTPELLDKAVLAEFRRGHLVDAAFDHSDEELLYQIGALDKDESGYFFTNAGLLFFSANPQRMMPYSYIRLLRYAGSIEQQPVGLPTLERSFTGPLSKQIRDIRTFFQESGFFKTYQRRNPQGGFIEEPEYPLLAVDEAIVNAVAHRDYAIGLPIECEAFQDGLIVGNPGRMLQRDGGVPSEFTLDSVTLTSTPRNPQLIEWLKSMKDARGAAFLRALSEGTRTMLKEMRSLQLSAPSYRVSNLFTTVALLNDAAAREAALLDEARDEPIELANLFPIAFQPTHDRGMAEIDARLRNDDFMHALRDALTTHGWFIDGLRRGVLTAHRRGVVIPLDAEVMRILRFFPANRFQLRKYWGRYYLCVDYSLEVKNARSIAKLLLSGVAPEILVGRMATAQWNGWCEARVIAVGSEQTRVLLTEFDQEQNIPNQHVIPHLPIGVLGQMLDAVRIEFDLHQQIKQHSLALVPAAARLRMQKVASVVDELTDSIFPLSFGVTRAVLTKDPLALPRSPASSIGFSVSTLSEPLVEFSHNRETPNIREGITSYGAYDTSNRSIELVPLCLPGMRHPMAQLIGRLQLGKYKYRGAERTFHARFTYASIIEVDDAASLLSESQRLLQEHPEWIGDTRLLHIFLVHTPERGFAADDHESPYYRVKRYLLENGIPCQMIDTPTLQNPDWKDLNLALNLAAKCGITPWVLPDAIPDADFFVGLSYTSHTVFRGRLATWESG
jgi:predicted HTH transcriptional regulator